VFVPEIRDPLQVKYSPKLEDIIAQVPNIKADKLKAFNAMLGKEPAVPIKARKEAFRELLSGAIGKHIGEVFRRPMTFDLPEMQFKHRSKQSRSDFDVPDLTALFGNDS